MDTKLILKEPERYLENLHNELDYFFKDFLFENPLQKAFEHFTFRPKVEIKQNNKNYTVKVQIPGVKKDDINIELDNDFLTIVAEHHEEKEENEESKKNEKLHRSEFRYGKYVRTVSFDSPINIDECKAGYKNGILTITVPKQQIKDVKAKRLEIKD